MKAFIIMKEVKSLYSNDKVTSVKPVIVFKSLTDAKSWFYAMYRCCSQVESYTDKGLSIRMPTMVIRYYLFVADFI